MVDINHRVGIKAPISQVYQALATTNGIAGWWTQETTGTSQVGAVITTRFVSPEGTEIGSMDFEVIAMDRESQVQWRVKAGPPEWIGTDIVFRLYQDGEYTIVLFSHQNWRELVEFTHHCSMKWAIFMLSLKQLVETGTGMPSPHDIKIDNWN